MNGSRLFLIAWIGLVMSCVSPTKIGTPINIQPYMYQVGTRVSYSGEWDGDLERIDWTVGDVILIQQEYNGQIDSARYRITSFNNNGYRSQAQIQPIDEPLTFQGDGTYVYRGYYPGNEDHLNKDTYLFTVDAKQDGKESTGLFMTVRNFIVNNEEVKLEFSPVVNAYQFTLPTSVSKVQLESFNNKLAGNLTIRNGNVLLDGTSNIIEVPVNGNTIRIFTLPQDIPSSNMLLRVYHNSGINVYDLEVNSYETFGTYQKFNFPAISNPIRPSAVVNGLVAAEAHKRNLNWQFGNANDGQDPDLLYGNNPDNNNAWEPIPPEKLWEIIESVVDLQLSYTWEAKEISAEDINVFPNLRTIDITCSNLESIEVKNPNITSLKVNSQTLKHVIVENCDGLTTFNVWSNNNLRSVTVRNNANLKDFTIEGSGNFSDTMLTIICENCPELTTFTWKGGDGWGIRYHKEIINCPKFGYPTTPSGSVEQ